VKYVVTVAVYFLKIPMKDKSRTGFDQMFESQLSYKRKSSV